MRTSQSKRMRGRNRGKSQNPLSRVYESNGPDVKIRGPASHIAEKYIQLARDAQSSGDPIAAESYYQHAEHYFRLIAAAQEQYRQSQPFYRPEGDARGDDSFDEGDDEGSSAMGMEPNYGPREPHSFQGRDNQPFPPRESQPSRESQPYPPREPQPYPGRDAQQQPQYARPPQPANASQPQPDVPNDVERLPSFITGGGQPQPQPPANGQNGHEAGHQGDRFPLHRRRRRHRGPRTDAPQQGGEARPPSE
jgi:hypothetical protein